MTNWTPTRATGETILQAFVPRMGSRYANGRNTDHGPGAQKAVSGLSPFIRRRLVLESDAVAAALAAHGPEHAEKFVQEVIWRGYFKGWLERRPQAWASYVTGLEADLAALDRDRRRRHDVDRAMSGQTGLECFDAWATELVDTGYLHNHARMWVASIWIFTLGLPWRLGADFFYRHLLDGDAASNTLGWRWVAGLHTRGKPYPADAQNIATFTAGRFTPRPADLADLAEVTEGLKATEPDGLPSVLPLRAFLAPKPGQPTALLHHDIAAWLTQTELPSPTAYRLPHAQSYRFCLSEDASRELAAALAVWTLQIKGLTKMVTRINVHWQVRQCVPETSEVAQAA